MTRSPGDEPEGGKRRLDAEQRSQRERQAWFRLSGVGLEFAIALIVCLGAGYWLDKKLGTGHWLVIVGGAVGFTIGLTNLLRAAKNTFKD